MIGLRTFGKVNSLKCIGSTFWVYKGHWRQLWKNFVWYEYQTLWKYNQKLSRSNCLTHLKYW